VTDQPLSPRQRILQQLQAQREEQRQSEPRRQQSLPTNIEALLPLYVVARGTNPDDLEQHINLCAGDGYEVVPGSVAIRPGTIVCVMVLLTEEEPEPVYQPEPAPAQPAQPAQS